MASNSLFQLSQDYKALSEALWETVDSETGEVNVDIAKALEQIEDSFEHKAIAVATVYRDMETYGKNIEDEIKRLKALQDRTKRQKERLSEYLANACLNTGIVKIEGVTAKISFKKSSRTEIYDENILPDKYVIAKTTFVPDKKAIKEAIERGEEVQGARIVISNNIQIK